MLIRKGSEVRESERSGLPDPLYLVYVCMCVVVCVYVCIEGLWSGIVKLSIGSPGRGGDLEIHGGREACEVRRNRGVT